MPLTPSDRIVWLAWDLPYVIYAYRREDSVDRPGHTILIAERNANIRELLRREFGREGHVVVTAGSGAEVLTWLAAPAQVQVDVLVLDAEIAAPDGELLAKRLARLRPALPVVLHVFPGLDTGTDGFARVEKGGDFERLKAVVRAVLDGPDRA